MLNTEHTTEATVDASLTVEVNAALCNLAGLALVRQLSV